MSEEASADTAQELEVLRLLYQESAQEVVALREQNAVLRIRLGHAEASDS